MFCDRVGSARVVTASCPDYPRGLQDLPDAPRSFRVLGELPDLRRAVCIVGTRRADDEALDFSYQLGRDAALRGWVVVSGGAIGIDRAAHEGALDGRGRTVVVLPIGLDDPYPAANHDLFSRVVEAGCLLTEVPDGTPLQRGRFLTRNRLVAALGAATVVVQAPARSGALSTAAVARRLGRRVFAVPASPWDSRGSGNLRLLREGARICANVADVLSESAPWAGGEAADRSAENERSQEYDNLSLSEQKILDSLRGRARHPEDLCQRTGISAPEVQRAIVQLLVRGAIEEKPGGRYQRCRPRSKPY